MAASGCPQAIAPPYGFSRSSSGGDAHPVAPGQDLHRERLVQLEEVDVVEREAGALEHALRRGDGADAHQLRLDARVREADEAELRREVERLGRLGGGEQRGRRAVGQPGGVARGDAAAGAERRAERRERLERRVRAEELVAVGDAPTYVCIHSHRNDRFGHDAVVPGGRGLALRLDGEPVGVLLRELRKLVVEVLGGRAHRHRGRVHEPLGDEARVEVDVRAHRVVTHVLDAARDDHVAGAHRDLPGAGGHGGQGARAHAVDGEAGDALRDAGEQRDVAAERQPLVADLRGRGEDDVADPLGLELRAAAQELAHDLDAHVVRARAPEDALLAGAPERRAHTVDEDDLAVHVPSLLAADLPRCGSRRQRG